MNAMMSQKRDFNTDCHGNPFSEEVIQQVWEKGMIHKNGDKNTVRIGACGHLILRQAYGGEEGLFWHVDHRKPVAKGGTDDLENLQPMEAENNIIKGDDYPEWRCKLGPNRGIKMRAD